MGLLAFDGKNSMTKDISLLQSLMQLAAGETFQSILINGAVPDSETFQMWYLQKSASDSARILSKMALKDTDLWCLTAF